jgi:CBS domain-containing protein
MQVQDVMTKTVKVIDSTATLLEAAEIMRDEEIGALPVANAGRPIGMLTDRDIVVRALASYKDPSQTRVRDIITPRLTTIYADQDISEAAALMAHQQIRRLLVLDHDQAPVGILSLGDISLSEADKLSAASASGQALKGVSEPTRDDPTERRSKP